MSSTQYAFTTGHVDAVSGDRRFFPIQLADEPFRVDYYRACALCKHHRRAAADVRLCLHPDLQTPGQALTVQQARHPSGGCGTEAGRAAGPWSAA